MVVIRCLLVVVVVMSYKIEDCPKGNRELSVANSPKFNKEKPFFSYIPFNHLKAKQANLELIPELVTITSIRGYEKFLQLDSHGFEVFKAGSGVDYDRFADNNWIQEEYCPVIESWLRRAIRESQIEQVYNYYYNARTNRSISAASSS